jgi:hypothetical protein
MTRSTRTAIRRVLERLFPRTVDRYRAFRGRRMLRRLHPGLYRRLYVAPPGRTLAGDHVDSRAETFEQAYRTGIWTRTGESLSGEGSTLAYTEELRRALPDVLRALGVRTLLDVPCGDWNWMSQIDLPVERYIGGELVPAVVEENEARFGNARIEFRVIDLCVDPLPAADLLLCRDALVHFSYADIWRALENILAGEIAFLATTTFPGTKENADLVTGIHWRHLNLEAAPFRFPPPLLTLPEGSEERWLGIWRVSDLRDLLRAR